ncbi:hypothetical protein QCA50_014778 [Cerrena zonata]|uniref:F-box domain-containing protein n=1 Tax=Cerrena zonata TaxID=2478898 RepID=A0AAW0FNC4_9APHY
MNSAEGRINKTTIYPHKIRGNLLLRKMCHYTCIKQWEHEQAILMSYKVLTSTCYLAWWSILRAQSLEKLKPTKTSHSNATSQSHQPPVYRTPAQCTMYRCSAVHRTLNIAEIVDIIFSCLRPHSLASRDDARERRQALASAARTCKSFSDLALASLWWEQDSLDPILAMIPTHNSHQPTQAGYDLNRLVSYSKRVRKLEYSAVTSEIDILKLALLYKHHKGNSLFPNLQFLRLGCWPLTVTEASLLFGPMLQTIQFLPSPLVLQKRRCLQWGRLSKMQQQPTPSVNTELIYSMR